MYLDLFITLGNGPSAPQQVSNLLALSRKIGYDGAALTRTVSLSKLGGNDLCSIPRVELPCTASTSTPASSSSSSSSSSSLSSGTGIDILRLGCGDALSHPSNGAVNDGYKQFTRLNIILDDVKKVGVLGANKTVTQSYDLVSAVPQCERSFALACTSLDIDIISIDVSQHLQFRPRRQLVQQAIARGVYFEMIYHGAYSRSTSTSNTSSSIGGGGGGGGGSNWSSGQALRYFLSNALQIVQATQGQNVILSSAATTSMDLRGPHDIMNLCGLVGMDLAAAKQCLSTHCLSAILRASARSNPGKMAIFASPLAKLEDKYKWTVQGHPAASTTRPSSSSSSSTTTTTTPLLSKIDAGKVKVSVADGRMDGGGTVYVHAKKPSGKKFNTSSKRDTSKKRKRAGEGGWGTQKKNRHEQ